MPKILHVRHGRTDWNDQGRYTGQSDIPLNEEGRQAAYALAGKLQKLNVVTAYSSDLDRAAETAKIILNGGKLPIQYDKRLREIHQGVWEGMLFPDIKAQYANKMKARKDNPLSVAPPKGESLEEFQNRVLDALSDICAAHSENETVLIVSHGLTIAICRVYANHLPIEEVWNQIPANTEIIEMTLPSVLVRQ